MERPKYRYHLAFQCTKNGHFRTNMTYYVNDSEIKYTGTYLNTYEEQIYTTWQKRQEFMRARQKELELQYSRKLSQMT